MDKRQLYEWAEGVLLSDEVDRFEDECRRKGKDLEEYVSYEEFDELRKEFGL
jgi:hypothetical protein